MSAAEYIVEEEAAKGYIVRQVEKIEFPCKHHDQSFMWYSGGLKSESFGLVEQNVLTREDAEKALAALRESKHDPLGD